MTKMRESIIEKKFRQEVEKLGGWALKFIPDLFSGFPDRIVLLPGGRIYFAELKQNGKKLRKLQNVVCRRIERLGFRVDRVDGENLAEIIKTYEDEIHTA